MRINKKKLKEIGFVDDVFGINSEYEINKNNKLVYFYDDNFILFYYKTYTKCNLVLNLNTMKELKKVIKILKRS